MKPLLITEADKLNLKLAPTRIGESVIFHDKLIHGGKLNTGTKTRVSIEFTTLVSKN